MTLRRPVRRRVMRVWGVKVRPHKFMCRPVPCLFYSRRDAEQNREPDEDLVLVRVEIVRTIKSRSEAR